MLDVRELRIGDAISFRYKGNRFVNGEIITISKSFIVLKLKTDYIGKNEAWYVGESKHFNIKEIKH